MKAKDYFLRARSAEQDIRRLTALREHYMEMGSQIASHWGNTPPNSASNSSKVESAVCGLLEAEEGVLKEWRAYEKIILEAELVISKVRQSKFRQILTLHYLCGLSLAETGRKLEYIGENSIYRAHGWALVEAQKVIDRVVKD